MQWNMYRCKFIKNECNAIWIFNTVVWNHLNNNNVLVNKCKTHLFYYVLRYWLDVSLVSQINHFWIFESLNLSCKLKSLSTLNWPVELWFYLASLAQSGEQTSPPPQSTHPLSPILIYKINICHWSWPRSDTHGNRRSTASQQRKHIQTSSRYYAQCFSNT